MTTSSVLYAEETNYTHPSDLPRALELFHQVLYGKINAKLWVTIRVLSPRGPVFVDKALEILANDNRPWKALDRRDSALGIIEQAISLSTPWENFEDSPLKASIHANAHRLLQTLYRTQHRQREVVGIYDSLSLWDKTDLPFLIMKLFNGGFYSRARTRSFIKAFEQARETDKDDFAGRVRNTTSRNLLQYLILYRHELILNDEIGILYRVLSSHGARAANDPDLQPLLGWVLRDLHKRLHDGDPEVMAPYTEMSASEKWKPFLQTLWEGNAFPRCEGNLW